MEKSLEEGPTADRSDHWSELGGAERIAEATETLTRLGGSAAEARVRARYLDLLSPQSGEIVIDVGAGAGAVTVELARRVAPGGRVFAVDPSAGLLDAARAAMRQAGVSHLVDCRVADGRGLPFGPAAFDAALCHWVLLHVDRPGEVIAEMKRVTRRGGRVLSVEMDWETAMVHPGNTAVTRKIFNFSADRHVDAWIGRRLAGLFNSVGFADVVIEPIVLIDRGRDDRAWIEYLEERARMALAAGVIGSDDLAEWMQGIADALAANTFFFAVTQFAVLGRVPA